MSEELAHKATSPGEYAPSSNAMVEEILELRMPLLPVLVAARHMVTTPGSENALRSIQAQRERLLALSPSALREAHALQLAEAEAARFPSADLAYWTQLEHWTLEEAVALLLGRAPEKVTAKKLKTHQRVSPFPAAYARLSKMAQRATAMTHAAHLKPTEVLAWAREGGVAVSPELSRLVEAEPLPHALLTTEGASPRWTEERLAELRSYRDEHGAKAAGDKFGISDGRVRQLLPKEPRKPSGHSVFSHRFK